MSYSNQELQSYTNSQEDEQEELFPLSIANHSILSNSVESRKSDSDSDIFFSFEDNMLLNSPLLLSPTLYSQDAKMEEQLFELPTNYNEDDDFIFSLDNENSNVSANVSEQVPRLFNDNGKNSLIANLDDYTNIAQQNYRVWLSSV
ncbi:hypothetical protein NCAS_0G01840 [Naumovozyma castellii]|uniref:Uncharacterized protein n=1 Tax=Naumovozyma castellii TaxID=27288 RepID=G0VI37_NAUCA|nr:hypothetical protein NCAS_0G01840 [Naumovozyma castellii CBS 4309]CCC71071.1 hypothetical protein NCAS_0G01840 [Naumovozyma castellii CBS 4309]